ncbi:SWR1-complex protein 5 [Neolecta irregularis DAH-3]|uniref:SWR1-complex protein 5 n=1 Tax=Neolecta irregularis (strain DAH-3) TaxID=1198029 RepID=A0A1U7LI78_NEOID|nr:SWR1-complex protein 5 [Neolecta irregularis DAH-3]|eukprot:OLL22357.1 SWR1-complex protein 5 [Neolecta irregularis DAH-3]
MTPRAPDELGAESEPESEDGDFRPEAGYVSEEGKSDDQDSGDEITIAERAIINGKRKRDTVGGDHRESEKETPLPVIKADVDLIWKQLNEESKNPNKKPIVNLDETITIRRTYEFAGKTHSEEKVVRKDSEEARSYLNSLEEPKINPVSKRAPPKKRQSAIEAASAKKKVPKLNTLEKSKLDWAGFVDREGISSDLKQHNKDGYMEKQDFLKRTEERRYQDIKNAQKK